MGKYYANQTLRDKEYVDAYIKTHSQIKAAALCGVGRETIARAVRRANIKLTGRADNGKKQPGEKITDDELIIEAKTMNCNQIATKHKMSVERVYRRAKKLGIEIKTNDIGGHWRTRATRYGVTAFDETITLKEVRKRFNDVCQICGKPVDDSAIENGHIKRMYPTVDHIIPLSKGGTHTWDNVQLAHMYCNAGKCDK